MRFLIAPDKFKGSLAAQAVGQSIASGIADVCADAEVEIVSLADGGEGTAEAIYSAIGGEWVNCVAHDALSREIKAWYLSLAQTKTVVIEMSEAAGLHRLAEGERDPLRASTFGVGEMMRDALRFEPREIIV